MSTVRRIVRAFLLLIWMPASGLFPLLFFWGSWGNIKRVCYCARIWGGGIACIISMKKKIFGDMSQLKGGLIVSNHTGYLDIIAHASSFPIRFTPKQDIRKWPVMGWYVGIGRPIWVDRSSKQKSIKLKKEFVDTMMHGIPLIIYPEGTSTDGFSGILPFKSTPFAAVAETDLPIIPVVTIFDPPDDGSSLAWYGQGDDASLIPHCWQILGHKKIEVELHILPVIHPEGRNRKELAVYVHGVMQKKYEQIMHEKGYSIKGQ